MPDTDPTMDTWLPLKPDIMRGSQNIMRDVSRARGLPPAKSYPGRPRRPRPLTRAPDADNLPAGPVGEAEVQRERRQECGAVASDLRIARQGQQRQPHRDSLLGGWGGIQPARPPTVAYHFLPESHAVHGKAPVAWQRQQCQPLCDRFLGGWVSIQPVHNPGRSQAPVGHANHGQLCTVPLAALGMETCFWVHPALRALHHECCQNIIVLPFPLFLVWRLFFLSQSCGTCTVVSMPAGKSYMSHLTADKQAWAMGRLTKCRKWPPDHDPVKRRPQCAGCSLQRATLM